MGSTPPLPQAAVPGDHDVADVAGSLDPDFVSSELDDQGAIIQGDYSEVDDIFFQRPEED